MPIFVMQGKCLFKDISRSTPVLLCLNPEFFLLVDLQEFFLRVRGKGGGGDGKKKL